MLSEKRKCPTSFEYYPLNLFATLHHIHFKWSSKLKFYHCSKCSVSHADRKYLNFVHILYPIVIKISSVSNNNSKAFFVIPFIVTGVPTSIKTKIELDHSSEAGDDLITFGCLLVLVFVSVRHQTVLPHPQYREEL